MVVPRPGQQCCVVCKQKYPLSKFGSSKSPACRITAATQGTTIIDLPPGVCSEHVSRLTRVERTKSGGKNEWVSNMDVLCLGCGVIKSWKNHSPTCRSTSSTPVRVYVRYLNNNVECQSFYFWRQASNQGYVDADGRGPLMVKEVCRQAESSGNGKHTVDMMVHGMSDYVMVGRS